MLCTKRLTQSLLGFESGDWEAHASGDRRELLTVQRPMFCAVDNANGETLAQSCPCFVVVGFANEARLWGRNLGSGGSQVWRRRGTAGSPTVEEMGDAGFRSSVIKAGHKMSVSIRNGRAGGLPVHLQRWRSERAASRGKVGVDCRELDDATVHRAVPCD